MKHVRTLTLCLLAVYSFAALAASSAQAKSTLPEWGKCEPTENSTGGKYGNAGCTALVKPYHKTEYLGGYEWYPLQNGEHRQSEESGIFAQSGFLQPVPTSTISLPSGFSVTCTDSGDKSADQFYLGGGPGGRTVGTPFLEFRQCFDNQPGEEKYCHTTDANEVEEVVDETASEKWLEQEPGAWLGSMAIVEGKNTTAPKVALEWKTEQPLGAFFQQIVCGTNQTIEIGGGQKKEALAAQIEPVNQMSASFTTQFSPTLPAAKGTKPVEALVLEGTIQKREPITFEASTTYTQVVPWFGNINHEKKELELKATP